MMNATWVSAVKLSYPVAMGYLPAGLAFGVLFVAAGLPVWAALFASVVFYAGAAQYAAISMLSGAVGLTTLATNTLAINLRHMFYAMPLLRELPSGFLPRYYCLFALTDETFSVLTTLDEATRARLIFPISLLNHSYWIIGTLLGVAIGAGLNDLIPNLDFALVCLFAILAYEQFKALKQLYPLIIATVAFVIAMQWFANWLLLTAIALSILMIIGHYFVVNAAKDAGKDL